ncbi:MAG TPA: prolipoprotein diacylglyceryl transferase [Ktedonobacterales bacterium]|nr:prolipoprotein diacylglyceryl transferase [Ktedonobacterales bacterium]
MVQSLFALSYIIINIDPVFNIGPLTIHWYGVAYVVGIVVALWAILRYAKRLGLDSEIVYSVFWWAALAGLVGGRLYFVIQQPDLVTNYLEKPLNIIAVWNGGMAVFGAIFLGVATVAFVSWRIKLPVWLALDIATFFAAVGQIFGRLGNLVNGDIVGYPAGTLSVPPDTNSCALPTSAPCLGSVSDPQVVPWATLYANPHAFTQTSIPVHPAAAYEIVLNLALLAILLPLLLRLPRIKMGLVSLFYLVGYAVTQFIVFFFRGSEPTVPFLGIDVLKQAQWTAVFVLIAMIPYYFLVRYTSHAWTKEEAEAVNAHQAQRRQPTAGTGKPQESHEHQTREHHQQESGEARQEEQAEIAPAAEHTRHDAMKEQGLVPEYDEGMAAELRTEGIAVSSTEEPDQTNAENGGEPRPQRGRARTSSTGESKARRSRSSAKKAPSEE